MIFGIVEFNMRNERIVMIKKLSNINKISNIVSERFEFGAEITCLFLHQNLNDCGGMAK